MSSGLHGRQILVLEGDSFVSLDLVSAIEQLGGTALVAPTMVRAREVLKLRSVAGAAIDLTRDDAGLFCGELAAKGVPFVVHSGGTVVDVGAAETFAKPPLASAVATAVASALQRPRAPAIGASGRRTGRT